MSVYCAGLVLLRRVDGGPVADLDVPCLPELAELSLDEPVVVQVRLCRDEKAELFQ